MEICGVGVRRSGKRVRVELDGTGNNMVITWL